MKKALAITLTVDAKTGEVTAVRNSFEDLDRQVKDTNKGLAGMMPKLMAIGGVAGTIYGLAKAFSFVVRSGFDYNKQMDASTAKLTAMISASKGYVTVAGEQVTAMQRQKLISQETVYMMQLLKQTNADTAMGMSDLVDIYALAKPGMDRYKWAVKDQIEIVKLASNTASNFGMSAEELSSGIDDLAAGTWEASSGFGKMMKSLGVSRQEYQATADKVAYLKEKMKETGAAQDTWAVATSNFQVAWDNMAGQITQPIFDGVKEAIKYVTTQMNSYAPDAMQVFSDALVGMVNGAISAVGTLIGWISKLVSGFRIAYAGYKKLAGAARAWWNNDNAENSAKLQALEAEQDRLKSLGYSYGVVRAKIRAIKKDMQGYDAGIKMWKEADKDLADIAAFDGKMQGIASTVKQIHIKKGIVNPISEAVKPTTQLAYKIGKVANNTKKSTAATKAHVQALKTQAKVATQALAAQKQLNREYLRLTHDKAGLFQLDVEETMQKFIDSGEYTAEQLSKIYDGMWEDYEGKAKEASFNVHTWLKDAFDIDSDSIFGKLFDDFQGMFDGFVNILKSDKGINGALADMDLGVQAASMLQKSGDPAMAAIGYGLEAVGALLSNTLSEAEIERARGRSEFESKALANSQAFLEKYQAPQLTATRQMLLHLQSMDSQFGAIAQGLAASTGFDFTGKNFEATSKAGFLGFNSSSTELLGAGVKFGEGSLQAYIDGMESVDGYQAVKVTSSSWWGLVKNETIKEMSTGEQPELAKKIGQAIGASVDSVMDAVEILGFDSSAIKAQLDQFAMDLGKLNFKDLSPEEMQQALTSAISGQLNTAFGEAINSVVDGRYVGAIESMQHVGEEYIDTLVRVATEQEVVTTQLALFGQTAGDFVSSDVLVQAAGGLENFQNAMSIFTTRFFSSEEQQQMKKLQLEMALQTQNVALPASKAQFKALELETQQQIITVKTKIEAMKAELIATGAVTKSKYKVQLEYEEAAARLKQQGIKVTYQSLEAEVNAKREASKYGYEITANGLEWETDIKADAAQKSSASTKGFVQAITGLGHSFGYGGKAAIGFGKDIGTMTELAQGALKDAQSAAEAAARGESVNFAEYDWEQAKLDVPEFGALNAELASLESLYGTLTDNMGDFADYYDALEGSTETLEQASAAFDATSGSLDATATAATSATGALTTLEQSLVSIANLKAVWGEDDISAKKIILDATIRETGMTDLTYDNFLARFEAATADGLGMDKETLQTWQEMSTALRNYQDALDKATEAQKSAVRKDISFYEDILSQIQDTYTGSLSSLFSAEKALYAQQQAQNYKIAGDTENYVKMLQLQLENDRKSTTTKEEYDRKLTRYREEIKSQNPTAVEEAQLETLQEMLDKLDDVQDAIENTDYIGRAS